MMGILLNMGLKTALNSPHRGFNPVYVAFANQPRFGADAEGGSLCLERTIPETTTSATPIVLAWRTNVYIRTT